MIFLHLLLSAAYLLQINGEEECFDEFVWTTDNGNILLNGEPFVLKGMNYFGFETTHNGILGLHHHSMDWHLGLIKDAGINTLRVGFHVAAVLDPDNHPPAWFLTCNDDEWMDDTCGIGYFEFMDMFIDKTVEYGFVIMLDNHMMTGGVISEYWYDDEYSEEDVIQAWLTVLDHFGNKSNVFALDLKNEPHYGPTWGTGEDTDWNLAAQRFIQRIEAETSYSGLYFVCGMDWGEHLEGVRFAPIDLNDTALNKRIVYTPHYYDNFPNTSRDDYHIEDWDSFFGYIEGLTGSPVVMGEWGGDYQNNTDIVEWMEMFVEYLNDNCMSDNFYWCYNPDTLYNHQLLKQDWTTPWTEKWELLATLQPDPTVVSFENGSKCIVSRGSFKNPACAAGTPLVDPGLTPKVDPSCITLNVSLLNDWGDDKQTGVVFDTSECDYRIYQATIEVADPPADFNITNGPYTMDCDDENVCVTPTRKYIDGFNHGIDGLSDFFSHKGDSPDFTVREICITGIGCMDYVLSPLEEYPAAVSLTASNTSSTIVTPTTTTNSSTSNSDEDCVKAILSEATAVFDGERVNITVDASECSSVVCAASFEVQPADFLFTRGPWSMNCSSGICTLPTWLKWQASGVDGFIDIFVISEDQEQPTFALHNYTTSC